MLFFVLALFTISFIPFLLMVVFIIIRKRNRKVFKKKLKDIQENSPYRGAQNNKPKNDFLFLEKEEKKDKKRTLRLKKLRESELMESYKLGMRGK